MKVGFTGSREGMSQCQREQLVLTLSNFDFSEFHHGDCQGADEQAHDIVREFFPDVKIHVRPPKIKYLQAFVSGDVIYPPDDYVTRDRRIVDLTDLLIGAPKITQYEELRSGSWTTIRYARRTGRMYYILER